MFSAHASKKKSLLGAYVTAELSSIANTLLDESNNHCYCRRRKHNSTTDTICSMQLPY